MDRHKRTRSRSSSSTSSSTSSSSSSFFNSKLQRPCSPPPDSFQCSLPPSCSSNPQSFPSSQALESHYKSYHLHTCLQPPSPYPFAQSKHLKPESKECGRIFPSDKILELHLKECHDPLTHSLQLSGHKTFECFHSPQCMKLFLTPKTRRLHLIAEHEYPKEYFFGVTVWGVGEVLKKGGSGMIRREWRARTNDQGKGKGKEKEEEEMQVEEGFKEPSPCVDVEDKGERIEENKGEDREMDELVGKLEGSSIGFVPRSVARRKGTKIGIVGTRMSIEKENVTT